ncbi:MAG: arylsulfatase [Flavobacteriaceae bacterium]|jgi:arylsulfatase A-like enzyme|nr:arylsulfatase [Flavobacteriaceae bacterium]MBT5232715.1 arylsulfatase [Flavobacteriaceae bacterium]MBT6654962.1 arylsulfatase [Flavobacteriaceae bacterium]MDB0023053.1 arylsulfatase [Flavobacteriaceae bacterium]MDB4819726.1 arylsulfatase [Flavobacteriaceae bacterium]
MKRFLLIVFIVFNSCINPIENKKPNVIIIMTDDQGFGDLGINKNPNIITPNIDQFASESVRFDNFFVSPVCAPTRASLMTGRYSLRTGVRDTYNGGAIMSNTETTIAEILKEADYSTGIFGKWHLGDNYPFRPSEQGFDESIIHLAGGIGQVGDFTNYYKGNTSYFDPILWKNNKKNQYDGYCSDIFAENAVKFIEKNKNKPFFCYLSFNAPHTPLQVPKKYYNMYKDLDPELGFNDESLASKMSEKDKEDARRIYGMVTNIDDNIGKVLNKLTELGIEEETIIIFMTDNGPQQFRYNSNMKGLKGTVYNGGTRVPFYIKYAEKFKNSKVISRMSAHIDILPTILELCNLKIPSDRKIDGQSLVPLINSKPFNDRHLFSYWTRRFPEKYINMSIQNDNYKLVGNNDYNGKIKDFELYDLIADPLESKNVINQNIEIAKSFKIEMDNSIDDLLSSENIKNPPRIIIGSEFENPTVLNRNDASGERGIWAQNDIYSYWKVNFKKGTYDFKFKFKDSITSKGTLFTEINNRVYSKKTEKVVYSTLEMNDISIENSEVDLISFLKLNNKKIFPFWIEIYKKN